MIDHLRVLRSRQLSQSLQFDNNGPAADNVGLVERLQPLSPAEDRPFLFPFMGSAVRRKFPFAP